MTLPSNKYVPAKERACLSPALSVLAETISCTPLVSSYLQGEHPFGFSILTAERTYELFTHSYQAGTALHALQFLHFVNFCTTFNAHSREREEERGRKAEKGE